MKAYSLPIEQQMQRFYRSLNERDRRRYAAIEATKLGYGGIEYISRIFTCDSKTIAKGIRELENKNQLDTNHQRKKGADEKR